MDKFTQCQYAYFLNYIMKKKENMDAIYLEFGIALHEALEAFYEGEKPYEHLSEALEETIFKIITLADFKFNHSDAEKNTNIEDKYIACLRHFVKNHKTIESKVVNEMFVVTTLEDENRREIFQGYIDAVHKEGKDIIITDYKTSTRYTGDKLNKHARQLILNALGVSQKANVPMENIKARWNFLKYCTVFYTLKNGKVKETICSRHDWVDSMKVNIRKKLTELKLEELEIDILMGEAISTNSIDKLPQSVRDAYTFDDCYVYVDLSDSTIKKATRTILDTIDEIKGNEASEDDEVWAVEVEDKDSYFCSQLCGYRMHCPYYKVYLDDRNMFLTKEDEQEAKQKEEESISEEDADWLKDMFG